MIYYNQNNYANVPYPAKGYESATVKSGGCGVVCASMVVENLTGAHFPPEQSAKFAIETGARVSGGTDMKMLGNALCDKFGLTLKTTSLVSEVVTAVKKGGIVIANVGGDRPGHYGVFSNGGHYLVIYSINDNYFRILDPGLYAGKYNKPHRKCVKVLDNVVIADKTVLDKDCANRNPKYYIFDKKETVLMDEPSFWAKDAWEKATKMKIVDGTNPKEPLTREQAAVILDRLKLLEE